jgi:hypothetical protein
LCGREAGQAGIASNRSRIAVKNDPFTTKPESTALAAARQQLAA